MASDRYSPRSYRYSFSGADARAYAFFQGHENEMCLLESMHTISASVHEAKGQARALGYRNIKGIARGIRTVAGSMIMTVVEDHPLRRLLSQVDSYIGLEPAVWGGWSFDRGLDGTGTALNSQDFNNRLATLLPPFNIIVAYVSEGAEFASYPLKTSDIRFDPTYIRRNGDLDEDTTFTNQFTGGKSVSIEGAGFLLQGIEIIDSGLVTSVNDVVSEMSFSFLCRDIKPMARLNFQQDFPLTRPTEEQVREEKLLSRLFGRKHGSDKFDRQQSKDARRLARDGKRLGLTQEEIDDQLRSIGVDPRQVK